jgi:hypothetical protein
MATQTKKEKVLPPPQKQREVSPPTTLTPESVAQWQDTMGDRFAYILWLACAIGLGLVVLGETLLGFLGFK